RLPYIRDRGVFLPAAGRLDRGSILREVSHGVVALDGVRHRARLSRLVRGPSHWLLYRVVPDRTRIGWHQTTCFGIRWRPIRFQQQASREARLRRLLL